MLLENFNDPFLYDLILIFKIATETNFLNLFFIPNLKVNNKYLGDSHIDISSL